MRIWQGPDSFLRRFALLALLGLAAAAADATVAMAGCAGPTQPARAMPNARVVFVGTITALSGSTATYDVEEIWKGPNLADPLDVEALPNAGILGDPAPVRQIGVRYLVFPAVASDGSLTDDACSATSVYKPEFDALRPANAHPPQGPPTSGVPGTTPIAAIFLAIVVMGAIGGFFLYRTGTGPAHSP